MQLLEGHNLPQRGALLKGHGLLGDVVAEIITGEPGPTFDAATQGATINAVFNQGTFTSSEANPVTILSTTFEVGGNAVAGTYALLPNDRPTATVALRDANGNDRTIIVAGVPTAYAVPVFTAQPSFGAASYTIGETVVIDGGNATPAGTVLSIERFEIDGTDISGELAGVNWPTIGEDAGTITLQVRATNGDQSALSDVVTATLAEPVAEVIRIATGFSAPSMPAIWDGRSIADVSNFNDLNQLAAFETDAPGETIVDVRESFQGDVTDQNSVVSEGDQAGWQLEVESSSGTIAVFGVPLRTAGFALRVQNMVADGDVFRLNIQRNPDAISGVYAIDLSGSTGPYSDVYNLDLADAITRAVVLAVRPITGIPDVGEVLTAYEPLVYSDADPFAVTEDFVWQVDNVDLPSSNSEQITVPVSASGRLMRYGVQATDANGPSTILYSPSVAIAATNPTADFTGPDGTLLSAYTANTGQSFNRLIGSRPAPRISNNRMLADATAGNTEYWEMVGETYTDVDMSCGIFRGASGISVGLIASATLDGGGITCVRLDYRRATDDLRLAEIINGSFSQLGGIVAVPTPTVDNTDTPARLILNGGLVSVEWNGVEVIAPRATNLPSRPGTFCFAHYRGGACGWDNLILGEP